MQADPSNPAFKGVTDPMQVLQHSIPWLKQHAVGHAYHLVQVGKTWQMYDGIHALGKGDQATLTQWLNKYLNVAPA